MPMSPSWRSSPCRAAWSASGPRRTVVPSSSGVRVMPSKRVAQWVPRWPWRRISYQARSRPVEAGWWVIASSVRVRALALAVVGGFGTPQARRAGDEQASPHLVKDAVGSYRVDERPSPLGPVAAGEAAHARHTRPHAGSRTRTAGPRRVGLRGPVHAVLPGDEPALHRTARGDPGPQGERPGGQG